MLQMHTLDIISEEGSPIPAKIYILDFTTMAPLDDQTSTQSNESADALTLVENQSTSFQKRPNLGHFLSRIQ
jgi:hypothetical protein